jgi:hypothetical protein
MDNNRGILLLAMGSPAYGNYAANLAMSIKYNYPNVPIALAYAGNAITHIVKDSRIKLFDHLILINPEHYTSNGLTTWIKAKNYIHSITPFEETLFLDADICLFPKREVNLESIMNELSEVDYTMANRDFIEMAEAEKHEKYSLWVNVVDVKKAWGIEEGKYYSCHSEFIWFKKSKTTEFFKLVEEIAEQLSTFQHGKTQADKGISVVNGVEVRRALFGGGTPDELPFAIAMAKLKFYPHKTPYIRIYWQHVENSRELESLPNLYQKYIGISWGGNITNAKTKKVYDSISKFYADKLGLRHTPLLNKKQFANGRNHF